MCVRQSTRLNPKVALLGADPQAQQPLAEASLPPGVQLNVPAADIPALPLDAQVDIPAADAAASRHCHWRNSHGGKVRWKIAR